MKHESARVAPDKPCVVIGSTSLTYAEVEQTAGLVAGNLLALGLEPGSKVAVQLGNIPAFLFAYFGIMRAGLVMVPLNPLLRSPEVRYHLADSDARVLNGFIFIVDRKKDLVIRGGYNVYPREVEGTNRQDPQEGAPPDRLGRRRAQCGPGGPGPIATSW